MIVIAEIVKLLKSDPKLALSIDGHTDATGGAERNRVLSRERAEAVLAAVVARGIEASRLSAQGFGPDKPLVAETDEASGAKDRRVEWVKRCRVLRSCKSTAPSGAVLVPAEGPQPRCLRAGIAAG